MSEPSPYAAKSDHPDHLWVLFLRKTPKAEPEMLYACAGGALQMLIAQTEFAKRLRVPRRKIEVCAYRPVTKAAKKRSTR